MPKDTYNVTFAKFELEFILDTLKTDQEDLAHHGSSYDFLNRLIGKIEAILERRLTSWQKDHHV